MAGSDHAVQIIKINMVRFSIRTFLSLSLLAFAGGCASGEFRDEGFVQKYQEAMTLKGAQEQRGTEGLDPYRAAANRLLPALEKRKGPDRTTVNLSLEEAVARTLANSPEITIVSFDPSIARENISAAASEFDVISFGQVKYDNNDIPSNNISEDGQSHAGLWELGIKQKAVTGAEWNLSYGMNRTVDESISRVFTTSYEPALKFTFKQPLLRDAWSDMNLAGVNISKLNYGIAIADFRRKAEDALTRLVSAYWILFQARNDVEIHQDLLNKARATLKKVEDRKNIDATVGDIKQTESAVKRREALLLDAKKSLGDVQDALVRMLADDQTGLTDDVEVIPTTSPETGMQELDQNELLRIALKSNPELARARLELEVEEINLRTAKQQKMPRLDIIASAKLQGLSDSQGEASDMVSDRDFQSYFLGLTLEYPLGNRGKHAEYRLRKLRHEKAAFKLHDVTDQVAMGVKERIRAARTAYHEIQTQRAAVDASRIHLQVIEDIGTVRNTLTPELLLTIIQAQESLAEAQRAEVKSVVDYNIALTKLSQVTGIILDSPNTRQKIKEVSLRE